MLRVLNRLKVHLIGIIKKGLSQKMNISKLINKEHIVLDLKAHDRNQVIEELIDIIDFEKKLSSNFALFNDVLKREEEYSTNLIDGLAIPHAISESIDESHVVIGVSKNGIQWEKASNLVYVVILVVVPKIKQQQDHLTILSQIASRLMDSNVVSSIKNASNEEEIMNIFQSNI